MTDPESEVIFTQASPPEHLALGVEVTQDEIPLAKSHHTIRHATGEVRASVRDDRRREREADVGAIFRNGLMYLSILRWR